MVKYSAMSVLLESERPTAKARIFLATVYSALTLGAVTMVYPFAVMLSASLSSNYDYQRHSPVVIGFFDPADRFARSLATCFRSFPRELYPEAPAAWTSWTEVAKDRAGTRELYRRAMDEFTREEALALARGLPAALLAEGARSLACNYDARDVAGFVRRKYGTLERLNAAWPVRYRSFFDVSFSAESKADQSRLPANAKSETWNELKLGYLERAEARGDFIARTTPADLSAHARELRAALVCQFREHGWRDFLQSLVANYRLVGDYLFLRGRAFVNTIVLVILSVLASLTVNPLAAYALSRFRLRSTERIILFLLATTAFPAAVTAIPGFLLIRDLGLLNTFAALVLPTVASGMSIFVLKGFFDALPRELYEAAAIDGAGERTVFLRITLPMTTPILAVNALNAFIHAYSSWEWAFLVCQHESHWTLAVWMYQMSQTFAHQPWCVMAGFVVVSIPTALVFLVCQKVILRGIVLPSMK